MNSLLKKIKNTIDFLIKHIKITKKDIYFGVGIFVISYYLNNLMLAANGYFTIIIPHNNEDKFFIKNYKGKTYFLYFNKTDFDKELDFAIKDKNTNTIISSGRCVLPRGYYNDKLGIKLSNDEVKCLIKEDYFQEKNRKKLLEQLKHFQLRD